ncbi:MAG: hypothetical protein LC804_22170 [Acidobacteria bacterium]|nr:hypothetical protein [Acidobacteriota bacterium]
MRQPDWNRQLGTPKSGRVRYVSLTRRLTAALADHRHLRSKRVDARRAGEGDSGARRACGPDDDAALHALSPAALDAAIRLLDEPRRERGWG